MTSAIYNEIEPFAAQWTRNLIAAGHVAPGVVDERNIVDLSPDDVAGVGQRHFFAGIAVWSYALRLAGIPDELDVWTGSCPCQPFSSAGKRSGFVDARHLWPAWFRLIRECRPAIVFGEQVASPDGRAWLDVVSSDLEGAGYSFGAANLCAGGIGAPHIRQRLYFVAHAGGDKRGARRAGEADAGEIEPAGCSEVDGGGLANARSERLPWVGVRILRRGPREDRSQADGRSEDCERLADTMLAGRAQGRPVAGHGQASWSRIHWLDCTDGKRRPTQPGIEPLAHGATARVGRLRAYGNAIVPQVAATFIQAAMTPPTGTSR